MLTSQEKNFLENNRSFMESKPGLIRLYNKVAFDLGQISGRKLSVLYAEAVGGYRFVVKIARVHNSWEKEYKFIYNIESTTDKNDRLRLGDDNFGEFINPTLEFQILRLGDKLKNLDSTFDLHNFKNLFDSAKYPIPKN